MSKLTTAAWIILLTSLSCARDGGKLECAVGKIGIANVPIKGDGMNERQISLTIDGSPTAVTAEIAEILLNKRIGASFFALGQRVAEHRNELKYTREAGHLIGNAGYSGQRLTSVALPAG